MTTVIPHDPQADALREALASALQHGETALEHVAARIRLMATAGAILEEKKSQAGWLDLHFPQDAPDADLRRKCIALHRELPKLDLDKRGDVVKAMTLADMLPGFDGPQGVSKRPISYLTPLYKLEQTLKGRLAEGVEALSTVERAKIKDDLRPLVEVWERL